jgi:hypothetical protein
MLKHTSRRAFAAALAVAAGAFAPAVLAQEHSAPAAQASSDAAYMAELHRQITELLTLVYAHADFDAVETHLTGLIRDNPDAIGGDAEAFATHVAAFIGQVSEQASADPRVAAEHTATMLIEGHRGR